MPRFGTALAAAILACLGVVLPVAPASASVNPKAGLSIRQTAPTTPTTAAFVAYSGGFPAPVVTYKWTFGDGSNTTTATPSVSHTYAAFGTYTVTVDEVDAAGLAAMAKGLLELTPCEAASSCASSLAGVGSLEALKVSGPTTPKVSAEVELLAAPYRIQNCDTSVGTDAAVTDSGFSGSLEIAFTYHPASAKRAAITCFASPTPFVDAGGKLVTSGALPACLQANPKPPCVQSSQISGSGTLTATKVLLTPPGDPKVAAH